MLNTENNNKNKALFIGHTYIDVTISADEIPTGDDKAIAHDYDFGIGGNATVAAITCAKLKVPTVLQASVAPDILGDVVVKKYESYGIELHRRDVEKTSLSLVLPNDGKRAILRARNTNYTGKWPDVSLENAKVLHLDGHQPEAALEYAKKCREQGILTSLDGGGMRSNTLELLKYIDVAVVAMRLCEQLEMTPEETIRWMQKEYNTPVAAVTMGEMGMIYAENGGPIKKIKALKIPKDKILDTTGAGDIYHGAYVVSYMMDSSKTWEEHFVFARAASSLSIQRMGTEASIPTLDEVQAFLEKPEHGKV